jgi:hypothetical protein
MGPPGKRESTPEQMTICWACDTIEVFRGWAGAPRQCSACCAALNRAFWKLWRANA